MRRTGYLGGLNRDRVEGEGDIDFRGVVGRVDRGIRAFLWKSTLGTGASD